jgi:hypothetical protein
MRARRSAGKDAGAVVLVLAMATATTARADDAPSAAERCVNVERIDQTRIVDEHSILFFMRDHTVLQNVLPRACPSLRKEDRIAYDVVGGRLCANELVTQLVDVGTYARGVRCALGMFVPIGDDEVQRLLPKRSRHGQTTKQPVVEAQPAELPQPAARDPATSAPVPRASESDEPGSKPEADAR